MRPSLPCAAALLAALAGCGGEDPGDGSFGGGSSDASSSSQTGAPTASSTTDVAASSGSSSDGGGSASSTDATSSASGGSGGSGTCTDLGEPCTACEATACPETYCDCYEDAECLALSACIVACGGTPECYQSCATDHPSAISRGALLVDCAARDCPDECPGYEPLTPCQSCLYTRCQDEMNTCVANPDCTALLYCIDACDDAECVNACYFEYPDGTGDVGPVGECLQDACPDECG